MWLLSGTDIRPGRNLPDHLLPLSIGNIIFLSLISYVILSIPDHMKLENEEEAKRLKTACNAIAILPVFGALTFFAGGIFDLVMLIRALA